MKNKSVSIHLLNPNNSNTLGVVKQAFHDNSKSAIFLTSNSLKDFEKKLKWFPTTFIVVLEEQLVLKAALKLVDKLDAAVPILLSSFQEKKRAQLPITLQQNYQKNTALRAKQERIRLKKIKKNKLEKKNL